MRGPTDAAKVEVRVQPPAEPRALQEAAERSESGPGRGKGEPSQSTSPPEPFTGPDPRNVSAVSTLLALATEGLGFAIARGKFLRSVGQGLYDVGEDVGEMFGADLATALEVGEMAGAVAPIALRAVRLGGMLGKGIRYALSKAAPERFREPPPPEPRKVQPGGAEPPRAPEPPKVDTTPIFESVPGEMRG